MTTEDQIRDDCNMILIERQQKYQLFHQVKLISMNILPVKRHCHLINNR